MQIDVKLFGILRDQVPAAKNGEVRIDLQNGVSVADLLAHLEISRRVEVAVNEEIETDAAQILVDGDHVHIFTTIGGGKV